MEQGTYPIIPVNMALSLCSILVAATSVSLPNTTVVLIHGAGGGGWEYKVWARHFRAKGYKVIAPDLVPVHGEYEQTTFQDYVNQVNGWIPKKSGRLVLVGASMGGMLALKVAEACHPSAVILANGVPPSGVGAIRKSEPYPPVVKWAHGPIKDTRDSMSDSSEAMIQYAFLRWRDESGAVMNALANGVMAETPKCPVLVIIGSADDQIAPVTSLAVARWANADVHRYAGMSHVGPLMSKRAGEVADSAIQWLAARTKG